MSQHLKYKGYCGSVEFSAEDRCLHGKILFINDLVTYEAQDVNQLEQEFKSSVDDYLETCEALGIKPDKTYSGSFNVRIGESLHKEVAQRAILTNKTINAIVKEALGLYLKKASGRSGQKAQ